jgi:hypothetical protein
MLPRRITNNLKEQNWMVIWVELLVVVVGVFMGLQVDNWNESRVERNTVKTYYDRLIQDLRTNERNLQSHLQYYQNVGSHAEAALSALLADQDKLGEQFLIDSYQATQVWHTVFNQAAYDEILSVGALSTIPDIEARQRLANYYVAVDAASLQLRDVNTYRELLRAHMPIEVQRSVETNCGDTVTTSSDGGLVTSFPEKCTLGLNASTTQFAIESILAVPGITPSLNRRVSDIDAKLRIMQQDRDRSAALADYLERTKP